MGRNMDADREGMQVRSTPQRLIEALRAARPDGEWFAGRVTYRTREEFHQWIANQIGRRRLDAFSTARERAQSLLIKRTAFAAEQEVRLLGIGDVAKGRDSVGVAVDPNALYDQVVLDPRLGYDDEQERIRELRSLGFAGPAAKSDLYQRRLLEIPTSWPT
jgi:hypothetical protein